jgi:hypothetical protein
VSLARLANPAASWLPSPLAANCPLETEEMSPSESPDAINSRTRSAKLQSGQRVVPSE